MKKLSFLLKKEAFFFVIYYFFVNLRIFSIAILFNYAYILSVYMIDKQLKKGEGTT